MEKSAYALNKKSFLDKYQIHDTFKKSGLEWERLAKIYEAYVKLKASDEFQKTVKSLRNVAVALWRIIPISIQSDADLKTQNT